MLKSKQNTLHNDLFPIVSAWLRMTEKIQEEDYILYGVGDQHHILKVLVIGKGQVALKSPCAQPPL